MKKNILLLLLALITNAFVIADNQTPTTTPVLVNKKLPFKLSIELEDFELPRGSHSGIRAFYDNKWIFLAGRTNGLHGFNNDDNNFPPQQQNHNIYVLDLLTKKTTSRSLNDPKSGLNQEQIDTLTVTSPQFYQNDDIIYMTGGYGVVTKTGKFTTKDTLTAFDLPGVITWVTEPEKNTRLIDSIRQINNPIFQVTGGYMFTNQHGLTLLIFGQNFKGYYTDSSNGKYTKQIRKFYIHDDGKNLSITKLAPSLTLPEYRRRDLNVVPVIRIENNKRVFGYTALSGVFTPSQTAPGVWTVPVNITADGIPSMTDPNLAQTFKQGMNNYASAFTKLFSSSELSMYIPIFGGLTYGYFKDGQFTTDSEIPFTNQITTIKIDQHGNYSQYLMNVEYPVIRSKTVHKGNRLFFGTGAYFMPSLKACSDFNFIFELDAIKEPTVIGYIVGGIQSTVPNTEKAHDSAASPYIFKVTIAPNT